MAADFTNELRAKLLGERGGGSDPGVPHLAEYGAYDCCMEM